MAFLLLLYHNHNLFGLSFYYYIASCRLSLCCYRGLCHGKADGKTKIINNKSLVLLENSWDFVYLFHV